MEKKKMIVLAALVGCLVLLLLAVILLLPKTGTETPDPTVQTQGTEPTDPTDAATKPEDSTQSETEPATEPTNTEAPADDTLRNPLNGQVLDAEYVGRIFAVTINNAKSALPFHGVTQADMLFEMYINDYATRCLALFSNISDVESIGSIRSARMNFSDICQAYHSILSHAGFGAGVREDLAKGGVDHMSADSSIGYRDYDRFNNRGYAWEHCLFAKGSSLVAAAEKNGFDLAVSGRDYGLNFTEDAAPADGVDAQQIDIVFTIGTHRKTTTMKYDETTGKYVFWQYNAKMTDENNGEDVSFENVIVMLAKNTNESVYHIATLNGQGDGYFACDGKIIPIRWVHENDNDPFTYFLMDGTPLYLGVGSTYVAIAPIGSAVNY